MKKITQYLIISALIVGFFASCDQTEDLYPSELVEGIYVANYGAWGAAGASISKLNVTSSVTTNHFYEKQNGSELLSNIQYMCEYNDSIYILGDSPDELIIMNPLFEQTQNGISEGLIDPRFCIGYNDYLYISCWGNSDSYTEKPNSYIAKFNTKTGVIDATIPIPGGTEGLAVAEGNLYVALNFKDSIAVLSIENDAVSYLATSEYSTYFVKDDQENLYVAFTSYSGSSSIGLGYINTKNNTIENTYSLPGLSPSYSSIMAFNNDESIIYVIASSWVLVNGDYVQKGSIYQFDVATETFTPFVEALDGIQGIFVGENDDIYALLSPSATTAGTIQIYNSEGLLKASTTTGISPVWALELK